MGIVIGISGKIGSGKTTFSKMLIDRLSKEGIIAKEKSFAEKLKTIASIISGLPIEDMYSQEGKNKIIPSFNMTVGQMQQKIGTEVFRDNFDQDVWIKALFNSYDKENDVWIISDVRFENEADAILNMESSILIRIEGDPAGVNKTSTRDKSHPSETALDNFPKFRYIIENFHSIEWLEKMADNICVIIKNKLCKQGEKV